MGGLQLHRKKEQAKERQKDRKIYQRKKVSRKIYMMKEREKIMPKILLMTMRTKARDDHLKGDRARDCNIQEPKKKFADFI